MNERSLYLDNEGEVLDAFGYGTDGGESDGGLVRGEGGLAACARDPWVFRDVRGLRGRERGTLCSIDILFWYIAYWKYN